MAIKSNTEVHDKPMKDNRLQSILNKVADSKAWEVLFQALLYGFVIWALYNLKMIYHFHTNAEWYNLPKYSILDFKYAIMLTPFFYLYKHAIEYIFPPLVKKVLNPVLYPTDEDKSKRAMNWCHWIKSIIYYSFSWIGAFLLFKNEFFWPKLLGGTAEPQAIFRYVPGKFEFPYGIAFYMVQSGHHLYTFIDYSINKRKDPKFWEMFLHHSMTVFLIFFSYMTGNVPVGILVLFVHDPSDIFLCVNRLFADMKNSTKTLQAGGYAVFVFSWVFFRLYAFPACIIWPSFEALFYNEEAGRMYSCYFFLCLMLTALLILHIYWFILILKVLVNIVRGKKNYNDYDVNKKKQKA